MSQSALVWVDVCLQRNCLNSPRMSHCRSLEGNEFHRRETPITKVPCSCRTAHITVSVEWIQHMWMSVMSAQDKAGWKQVVCGLCSTDSEKA